MRPGQHDRRQVGVLEDAGGGLEDAVRRAIGADAVLERALEHVIVGEQPVEERPGRLGVAGDAGPAPDPKRGVADRPQHVLEVLDRQEHGLQHRVDLVFDAAQALLRVHLLDLEVAVALLGAFVARPPHADDAFPLPPHREDRVGCREDAKAGLPEVVLEALEDERRVARMRLDDGRLDWQSLPAANRARLVLARVSRPDVDPGQALEELVSRRDLARDEAEVAAQARGQGRGRQLQGHPIRRLGQEDRRQLQQQSAVFRGGLASQDLQELV